MMYCKALVFRDYEIADKIMKETNPRNQKGLGRQVKNFSDEVWDQYKYNIVKEGCNRKFNIDEYKELLLSFDISTEFVEASPYDKIWGIGLIASDKRAQNKDEWQGENLLGKIITEIRQTINL